MLAELPRGARPYTASLGTRFANPQPRFGLPPLLSNVQHTSTRQHTHPIPHGGHVSISIIRAGRMRALWRPPAARAQLAFLTVLSAVLFFIPLFFVERRVVTPTNPEHCQFRKDRHEGALRDQMRMCIE